VNHLFRVRVTHATGRDQDFYRLSKDDLIMTNGAFLRDLLHLEGEGIVRMVVEVDTPVFDMSTPELREELQDALNRARAYEANLEERLQAMDDQQQREDE